MNPHRPAHCVRVSTLIATALASATLFAADVYRWVDERGVTHFGDTPPSAGAQRITLPSKRPAGDDRRQERTQRLLDEFAAARAEKKAAALEQAKALEARLAACDEARQRQHEYEHSRYLYEWDERGNKRVLGDDEHEKARATARADVEKWCD